MPKKRGRRIQFDDEYHKMHRKLVQKSRKKKRKSAVQAIAEVIVGS